MFLSTTTTPEAIKAMKNKWHQNTLCVTEDMPIFEKVRFLTDACAMRIERCYANNTTHAHCPRVRTCTKESCALLIGFHAWKLIDEIFRTTDDAMRWTTHERFDKLLSLGIKRSSLMRLITRVICARNATHTLNCRRAHTVEETRKVTDALIEVQTAIRVALLHNA